MAGPPTGPAAPGPAATPPEGHPAIGGPHDQLGPTLRALVPPSHPRPLGRALGVLLDRGGLLGIAHRLAELRVGRLPPADRGNVNADPFSGLGQDQPGPPCRDQRLLALLSIGSHSQARSAVREQRSAVVARATHPVAGVVGWCRAAASRKRSSGGSWFSRFSSAERRAEGGCSWSCTDGDKLAGEEAAQGGSGPTAPESAPGGSSGYRNPLSGKVIASVGSSPTLATYQRNA